MTPAEMVAVFGATPQEVAILLRTVLGLKSAAAQAAISPTDVLLAGVWQFMRATNFVSDAQAAKILAFVRPVLWDMAPRLTAEPARLPVFHLVFAEMRWVTWPTAPAWYDMTFDEPIAELPGPAVLLVVCDVTALFVRQQVRLAEVRNRDAQHPAGRPDPAPPHGPV